MRYLDGIFSEKRLFPVHMIDEIINDLEFEDSLHHDLRRLTFRYIIPHSLGKKTPDMLSKKEKSKGTIQGLPDAHKNKEITFWKNHYKSVSYTHLTLPTSDLV